MKEEGRNREGGDRPRVIHYILKVVESDNNKWLSNTSGNNAKFGATTLQKKTKQHKQWTERGSTSTLGPGSPSGRIGG